MAPGTSGMMQRLRHYSHGLGGAVTHHRRPREVGFGAVWGRHPAEKTSTLTLASGGEPFQRVLGEASEW